MRQNRILHLEGRQSEARRVLELYNYKAILTSAANGYAHYARPQDFAAKVAEYFKLAEDNPLAEDKVMTVDKEVVHESVDKVRAFTKRALCVYCHIPESRLTAYRSRKGFAEVVEVAEKVIWTQKFENAAAGLLNASIIGKDLGLVDKQEVATGAAEGLPPVTFNIVPVATGTFLPPADDLDAKFELPQAQTEEVSLTT